MGIFWAVLQGSAECVRGWGILEERPGSSKISLWWRGMLVRPPAIYLGLISAMYCVFGYTVDVNEYDTSPQCLPLNRRQ